MKIDPNLLIVMVGLPRSGKTTWAMDHIVPVVSPDAIREVLRAAGNPVVPVEMINPIAQFNIRALFQAGHRRVILDDPNVTRELRDRWYPVGKHLTWEVVFKHIETSLDICIKRATDEHIAVIKGMQERFEPIEIDERRYGE